MQHPVKKVNFSIDVNHSRPTPLNMLMQQSMEVLTKVVARKLQDSGKIPHAKGPLQVSFESKGLSIESFDDDDKNEEHLAIDDLSLDGDSDKEVIDMDNESNYHICSSDSKKSRNNTAEQTNMENSLQLDCEIDDSELHLNEEEGDIMFDYGTQEITGSPTEIGVHISKMLESALPNGFEHDGQGRLHAVVNGDELTITEQEFAEAMNSLQKIQTLKHRKQMNKRGTSIEPLSDSEIVEKRTEELSGDILQEAEDLSDHEPSTKSRTQRHTHSHNGGHDHSNAHPHCHSSAERATESAKTRRRHDYEYPSTPSRSTPNFGALLNEKSPLCLFCEYYMVFGEPPRNMIKWYNRTYEYEPLPKNQDPHHKHQHKRNR